MKLKIRHKTEGWTGMLELQTIEGKTYSSHRMSLDIYAVLIQDEHKPSGEYVEDPEIKSLDELEVIKLLKNT